MELKEKMEAETIGITEITVLFNQWNLKRKWRLIESIIPHSVTSKKMNE